MTLNEKKLYVDKCKILIIPDLHLKCTNPVNRKNYPDEILSYIEYILTLVEQEHIDFVIFLGDIYHDDFKGKMSGTINQKMLGMINHMKSQGTQVFTLMGNHEKHHFIKNCLFFHNIDYCSERIKRDLQATHIKLPEYPVATFQTCDRLILNDTLCIEMHHFSDEDKGYTTESNNYKYTIGLFHDAILPSQARKHIQALTREEVQLENGKTYMQTTDLAQYSKVLYNDEMFANLDYAVCGDIHTRIGEMDVQTSTGTVNVDIPGSLGRTSSSIAESHESVELPLFVFENNTLTKQHLHFKLWTLEQSYKISVVQENKQKYADMKEMKNTLEGVVVRKSFVDDIETFPNYAQAILSEVIQNGKYTLKSK